MMTHEITPHADTAGYWRACSCGWEDIKHATLAKARKGGSKHLEDAAAGRLWYGVPLDDTGLGAAPTLSKAAMYRRLGVHAGARTKVGYLVRDREGRRFIVTRDPAPVLPAAV